MSNVYRLTRELKGLRYPVSEVLRSTFEGNEESVEACCREAEIQCPDYKYSYEFLWEVN